MLYMYAFAMCNILVSTLCELSLVFYCNPHLILSSQSSWHHVWSNCTGYAGSWDNYNGAPQWNVCTSLCTVKPLILASILFNGFTASNLLTIIIITIGSIHVHVATLISPTLIGASINGLQYLLLTTLLISSFLIYSGTEIICHYIFN